MTGVNGGVDLTQLFIFMPASEAGVPCLIFHPSILRPSILLNFAYIVLMMRILKIFALGLAVVALLLGLMFGYKDIPVNDLKAVYAPVPSSFISIDGMEVHYRDQGNDKDVLPIVLIHGTGASLHTFDPWTEQLKSQYRVVSMDIPGFGLTGPFPDRDYSMDRYVSFVEQFLNAKGIQKCIIGGNSLGGSIAWQFAVKNPTMVDKLILIDAAGYPLQSESKPIAFVLARIPIVNKLLTFMTPKSMVRSSVENVYADKSLVTDQLVERYFKMTLRQGNRQALVDRMNMEGESDKAKLIPDIQAPTLVLWGEEDLLIPVSYAHQFHDDLPNSELVILKNMGHVPMEENPEASLVPVVEFLNKAY